MYAASTRFSADERAKLFAAMERTPAVIREIEAFAGPYPYSEMGGFVPATASGSPGWRRPPGRSTSPAR